MHEQEELGAFYRHFYHETLFNPAEPAQAGEASPGKPAAVAARPPAAAPAPARPAPLPTQPAAAAAGPAPVAPLFFVQGENRKQTAVVVAVPEPELAQLLQQEFLWNVLKAVQHHRPDVAVVNVLSSAASFEQLLQQAPFRNVLLFLSPQHPLVQNLPLAPYQPSLLKGVTVLLAAPLAQIEAERSQKARLWNGLQQVFL